jgi:hypothetical protein
VGRIRSRRARTAAAGRRLIYSRGDGEALLATVRDVQEPRIHPINVGIIGEHLYAFIIARSPKRVDLVTDGRFALHTHVDPAAPSEFSLRGRARMVEADAIRSAVATQWYFNVDENYRLFELHVVAALHGDRPTADDWPPRYSSWTGSEG